MKKFFNNWKIKSIKSVIIAIISILLLIGLDQLSKYLVVNDDTLYSGASVAIIPSVLNFDLCYNTGIAWGMFKNSQWFFAIVSFVFGTIGLIYVIFNVDFKNNILFNISLILIIGGTFGNGIDRAFFQKGVIDFISLEFWPLQNFPTFNVADSLICVGAFLLAFYILFIYKEPTNEGEEHA